MARKHPRHLRRADSGCYAAAAGNAGRRTHDADIHRPRAIRMEQQLVGPCRRPLLLEGAPGRGYDQLRIRPCRGQAPRRLVPRAHSGSSSTAVFVAPTAEQGPPLDRESGETAHRLCELPAALDGPDGRSDHQRQAERTLEMDPRGGRWLLLMLPRLSRPGGGTPPFESDDRGPQR
jgi:hypothetical protein